jgi:hypothetical protein
LAPWTPAFAGVTVRKTSACWMPGIGMNSSETETAALS